MEEEWIKWFPGVVNGSIHPYAVLQEFAFVRTLWSSLWIPYFMWSLIGIIDGLLGLSYDPGIKNRIYMHTQWAENRWCLRSHDCLFLRSHSLIKTSCRMWIMYRTVHDVAVVLWEWKRHVDAVHDIFNHILYCWYDWNISRCYTTHGKEDMFLLFLVVSFLEVYQLNKRLFEVVKIIALFE